MSALLFDPFPEARQWLGVASGEAVLHVLGDASALRLEFDFVGGKGFVVARREVSVRLPEAFAIRFDVQGCALINHLELKFEDPTRQNVWRWQQKDVRFAGEVATIVIARRDIEFAWGPQGGGGLNEVGAIEFAIVAGEGGAGWVSFSNIEIVDHTIRAAPIITVSSGDAMGLAWRSGMGDAAPCWQIDFTAERDLGGLALHWGASDADVGFVIEHSMDGQRWSVAWRGAGGHGRESYVRLADFSTRWLRLRSEALPPTQTIVLDAIELKPIEFGRSIEDFIHAIAAESPRGKFPRYWLREQSYWTPIASPTSGAIALMNEEGLVECADAAFALEPMLKIAGKLVTWGDASLEVSLRDGWMPVPTVRWTLDEVMLTITSFVQQAGTSCVHHVCYQLTGAPTDAQLLVRVLPFQATPPWQRLGRYGGVSSITAIRADGDRVVVNERHWIDASEPMASFSLDPVVPESSDARANLLSAVMTWNVGSAGTIALALPASCSTLIHAFPRDLANASADWSAALGGWRIEGDHSVREIGVVWRTALAHILCNREGPMLHPGPRRYKRCWIRDAAGMASALLRAGDAHTPARLLRAYAAYQREDGLIPCCVDETGPDWLIEYDSLGQFIYAVREQQRFSARDVLASDLWPHVQRAVECMEQLRATRLTDEFRAQEKVARFGLLPESASHEGYLAQPVHSYWDDFYALRGLRDASAMAPESAERERIAALAQDFERTLGESLRTTIAQRQLNYVPGSVEWADFDPTATAIALVLLDRVSGVPEDIVHATFDKYLIGFRDRVAGRSSWKNYSAYEVRIVSALLRLGRGKDALEVLQSLIADTRPRAWNQFPEITWRDPRSPGHIGDVPHTWIAAEYALAARSLFVYEHDSDASLVLAAGVPLSWLQGEGIAVERLPTPYGDLSYTFKQHGDTLVLQVSSSLQVPGGLRVQPPILPAHCTINGNPCAVDDIVVRSCPSTVTLSLSSSIAQP